MIFYITSSLVSLLFTFWVYLLFSDVRKARRTALKDTLNQYFISRFEPIALKSIFWFFFVLCAFSVFVCCQSLFTLFTNDVLIQNLGSLNSNASLENPNTQEVLNAINFLNIVLPTVGFTCTSFLVWISVEFVQKSTDRSLTMFEYKSSVGILLGLIFGQIVIIYLQQGNNVPDDSQIKFTGTNALVSIMVGVAPKLSFIASSRLSAIWQYFNGDNQDISLVSLIDLMGGKKSSVGAYSTLYRYGFKTVSKILGEKNYGIFCWILHGVQMKPYETHAWIDKLILREWAGEQFYNTLDAVQIETANDLASIMYDRPHDNLKTIDDESGDWAETNLTNIKNPELDENKKLETKLKGLLDYPVFRSEMDRRYQSSVKEQLRKLTRMKSELQKLESQSLSSNDIHKVTLNALKRTGKRSPGEKN